MVKLVRGSARCLPATHEVYVRLSPGRIFLGLLTLVGTVYPDRKAFRDRVHFRVHTR